MVVSLEWLHEATERVLFENGDIVKDALPPVGRQRFKLFCGVVVDVDVPGHVGVERRVCDMKMTDCRVLFFFVSILQVCKT
jgi:hypothetical protein